MYEIGHFTYEFASALSGLLGVEITIVNKTPFSPSGLTRFQGHRDWFDIDIYEAHIPPITLDGQTAVVYCNNNAGGPTTANKLRIPETVLKGEGFDQKYLRFHLSNTAFLFDNLS